MTQDTQTDKNGARDWPEDFSQENGNYSCRCSTCGEVFIGYKRRLTCKLCALSSTAKPSFNEAIEAGGKITGISVQSASAEPVAWVSETDLKAAKWGRCSNATLSARADTLAVVPLYRSPVAEELKPPSNDAQEASRVVKRGLPVHFEAQNIMADEILRLSSGPHSGQ